MSQRLFNYMAENHDSLLLESDIHEIQRICDDEREVPICEWNGLLGVDEGSYETSCGEIFTIANGGVSDNGFKFCSFCGGEIDANEPDYSGL